MCKDCKMAAQAARSIVPDEAAACEIQIPDMEPQEACGPDVAVAEYHINPMMMSAQDFQATRGSFRALHFERVVPEPSACMPPALIQAYPFSSTSSSL